MTRIRYSKAPIVEALLDFQIERIPDGMLPALKEIRLPVGYHEVGFIGEFHGQFNIDEQSPMAFASGGAIGYRFHSADAKFVAQIRLNGFTFSRMAPYQEWESFVGEAKSVWSCYRKVTGDVRVLQFSVRYINKLHLPPGAELSSYLRTYPEVSPALPQMLQGSFMRLELPLTSPEGILVLQQFYAPPDQPDQIGMILDNELRFRTGGDPLPDDELWDRVGVIREIKNDIFRGCLTPEMEAIIA